MPAVPSTPAVTSSSRMDEPGRADAPPRHEQDLGGTERSSGKLGVCAAPLGMEARTRP